MAFLDKTGLTHLAEVINAKLDAITTSLNGKSPTSHASSATTYGVSSASNYGHAKASSTSPKANGTAAVGSETSSFARGDHVHPLQTSVSGNAGTATKLATARTIGLGTGATGTATSFDGSGNITIPVTSVSEAYLSWGGKNISGNITPIGMACSTEHNANRLAFINGDALTFEYSSDGGSTWTDYGYNASTKSAFCTTSTSVPVGRASGSTVYTTSSKTRVTISAQSYVYTDPRKLLINVASSGSMNVLIEYKTGASNAAWQTFGTYSLSGWSGWNDIPLILGTLGGGSSQTSNVWFLRLTFSMTSINSSYNTQASVNSIRLFGTNNWTSASLANNKGPMSGTGHLYSYDINANATFPAGVQATTFTGALSGNATSATKLTTSNGSATQPVYFSDGKPVATTYALHKTVPSDAKFTDTTYSTGTASTSGLTKLYTGTGTATDGTMTQAAIKSALDSKAASSHGNHVPATETANNAKFLRNDNTWQTVTPANIGAATTSHNQASNTINAMTGYSKASTASAITTSDSLNTAIGKIEKALDGKAASSHGNHVPATETANNAKFLRNDNTWQTVTPANIGAATSSHTHNYAGSSSAGGAAKKSNSTVGFTTAGTGAAYTATVDGITALTAGVTFTMIPHTVSTTTAPTLNVNNLGAKNIRMRLTTFPQTTTGLRVANFLSANKPVKMLYDGNFWIIDDVIRTDANCLYGVVPIESGGTDANNAADARINLGIETPNGTTTSGNADYAEVGEWVDGNPDNEDRIGYFIAIDNTTAGTTMVKATSTSDVRGVTVASPAFSGNCSSDKFDIETTTTTDPVTGDTITTTTSVDLKKQYDYVAVMGLVSVIDNGTCTINGRCMPGDDGTAVPSPNNMGYQVIDRIDSTHVLIAVEPGADMLVRIKEDVTDLQDAIDAFVEISQSEIVEMFDDVELQPF